MIATKRMSLLAGSSSKSQNLGADIAQYKEESEKEQIDEVRSLAYLPQMDPDPCDFEWVQDRNVVHYDSHSEHSEDREELKNQDDVSRSEAHGETPLIKKMSDLSV